MLRFIGQFRRRTSFRQAQLTVQETILAEILWTQSCEQSTYQSESDNLTSKNKPRITLVKQLRLFLDDQRLIRCRGRIHNTPVSESTKFPILLPTDHPFTKLVVLSIHHQQLHSGVNSKLAAVRQRFWIPQTRQLLRKLLRKCVTCRKQGGKPYIIPDPPPLPKRHFEDSPPFTVAALYVKTSSTEVVENLSEETFLEGHGGKDGVRSTECGVRSTEFGVRSAEWAISDTLEHLVTRLFLTRPPNSIWRLTRSGVFKFIYFCNLFLICCFLMFGNTLIAIRAKDAEKHHISHFYLERLQNDT